MTFAVALCGEGVTRGGGGSRSAWKIQQSCSSFRRHMRRDDELLHSDVKYGKEVVKQKPF